MAIPRTLLLAAAVLAGLFLAGCQVPSAGRLSGSSAGAEVDSTRQYEQWLERKIAGEDRPRGSRRQEQSLAGVNPVQPASGQEPSGDAKTDLGASLVGTPAVKSIASEDEGFDWSSLEPQNVWKKMKAAVGYGPNEPLAQTKFKEGEALYREKKFDEAAAKFSTAAGRWPDSTLEEDALFYQAESYFFADRYGKAHDSYLMLFKKYPNSRYLDMAATRQFAIGRYWEQTHRKNPHWPVTPNLTDKTQPLFDTFGNAINAYNSVRINDPTGPLADDSLMATANAYFAKGRFEDAAYHYDLLRKEYPKSEHQLTAHLLGLQAKREMYQGPYYDPAPLKDADDIAQQTLTQFRGQLGEERVRVQEVKGELREQKAEREFAAGWFYEKKRAYGAARLYYQALIKDFAETHYAALAKERIEAIKDKPDKPPNYFKWLEDLIDRKR